jgi:aspartate/methionine/tyrosine aminotransferase
MRGCLQLKAALTRLNTNLVSQRGALAALRDGAYRHGAETAIRANLAHLEQTLAGVEGVDLAVAPRRGLACALELDDDGPTAQELMIALFARRVAVYPGDGLGEQRAATTLRLNLSAPRWTMEHLRGVLDEALAEAAAGRWRAPVAALLEGKGTARAAGLADRVRRGR